MGCLLAKFGFKRSHDTLEEEPPKVYSWDLKPKVDLSEYTFDGLKDQTVGRLPGKVNGQMFVIQNCQNCNIYIFDHTSTVTVDECVDCNFFFGPIQQSIFIRDCSGCKFALACQQFRLRDCQKLDAFLCCATQPIIESSSGVRLACFTYHYPELAVIEEKVLFLWRVLNSVDTDQKQHQADVAAGQFKSADLSVFNNNWSNIHDFSQDPTEKHYTLLPEDAKLEDYIPLPTTEEFSSMQIDIDPLKSVVPVSLGSRRKTSDESCLLVFFFDGNSQERALTLIDEMRNAHPDCVLVQTKEIKMQPSDAERVFGSDAYGEVVSRGPVIGLEYNGEDSIQHCQEVIVTITQGTTGLVFVSQSREQGHQQIENFYNFADLQMGI